MDKNNSKDNYNERINELLLKRRREINIRAESFRREESIDDEIHIFARKQYTDEWFDDINNRGTNIYNKDNKKFKEFIEIREEMKNKSSSDTFVDQIQILFDFENKLEQDEIKLQQINKSSASTYNKDKTSKDIVIRLADWLIRDFGGKSNDD